MEVFWLFFTGAKPCTTAEPLSGCPWFCLYMHSSAWIVTKKIYHCPGILWDWVDCWCGCWMLLHSLMIADALLLQWLCWHCLCSCSSWYLQPTWCPHGVCCSQNTESCFLYYPHSSFGRPGDEAITDGAKIIVVCSSNLELGLSNIIICPPPPSNLKCSCRL